MLSLFDFHLIESLQYIDENCITLLKTSTARQVFQVKDNHKPKLMPDRYYCAIDTDYCSCDAFRTGYSLRSALCLNFFSLLGLINDSLVFCEHLIATKIGIAINKYKVEVKSEEELDRIWSKHLINYRQ